MWLDEVTLLIKATFSSQGCHHHGLPPGPVAPPVRLLLLLDPGHQSDPVLGLVQRRVGRRAHPALPGLVRSTRINVP